jgi:dTDP-4-dehydrorhamnose reductase
MRAAVIGSNGQLGYDLCRLLGQDAIPLTHQDIEITDISSIREVIGREKPDAVINTAAFHNVNECEENPQKAFLVNSTGAYNAARAAKENGARYVYISTDYVFDGMKGEPYAENDPMEPLNAYGVSKAAGEWLTRNLQDKYFIVRTTGLYGVRVSRKGWNFVEMILNKAKQQDEVKVVTDKIHTPTYALELAEAIIKLLQTDEYGTYHITNEGQCSWYDFTKAIFENEGVETTLTPVTSKDMPSKIRRPDYSVLENRNLKKLGIEMSHWEDALGKYLEERKGGLK